MADMTVTDSSMLGGASSQQLLDASSTLVNQALQLDTSYADLSDLLKVTKHNHPTASGILEDDYPKLSQISAGLASLRQLSSLKKIPLPAELLERFSHMQCNCSMGLFAEINRAWLSIDSDIYVWRYEDGGDLAFFDGLSETIFCAGLMKPKPGIFQPHIQYLLCLATPVDIVLLGVKFTQPHQGQLGGWDSDEMHLLPEPLFSLPTDNIHYQSVVGTDSGRIFMAGKDGCLYELVYQAEDGWFSRKCRKVNHSKSRLSYFLPNILNFTDDDSLVQISVDNSRNALYTRSEKGTIEVYDLGEDGKGMTRVAAISQQTTSHNAAAISKTDRSNFRSLVHIAAIPRSESINCHLVAVTNTGSRLYFTTTPFSQTPQRPAMLCLIHVRLPPGFSASSHTQKPDNVHAALHSNGLLMLFADQSEDNDVMWTISPDIFPFQRQLHETFETTGLDGKTWAVAEVPSYTPPIPRAPSPQADPPAVVTQHARPDRKFVVINSQGSYVFRLHSPVDQLRSLLLEAGPDSEQVQAFFSLHKEQACATSLVLACNQSVLNKQVADLATRAFFVYGGEPEHNYVTTMQSPAPGIQPLQMSTPYPSSVAQQLQFTSPTAGPGVGPSTGPSSDIIFSHRLRGLCLYFARIIRTFWNTTLVTEFKVKDPKSSKKYLASTLVGEDLARTLELLVDLRDFVDKNSQFASPLLSESYAVVHHSTQRSLIGGRPDDTLRRRHQAEAEVEENNSMKQLQHLIHRCCETLALWKVLTDHQFHVVSANLSLDQQHSLRQTTFHSLVTQGKDVCQVLITSLINLYLEDNAATDAISARLREICPSLYTTHDQMLSKGNELLQLARNTVNKCEKDHLLQEALQKYVGITEQLDLAMVCEQFAAVCFFRGIVHLVLTAAVKRDPHGYALHYYKNGEPQDDTQGKHAFNVRKDCYRCITECLDFLLNSSQVHPQAPSIPRTPGPPPQDDPHTMTHMQAEAYTEEVFELALKSDDELFHVHLYEWLITKNLTEKFLEIKSSFVESYLKRVVARHPEQQAGMDLLWRYYEKAGLFSAAAKILALLAQNHSAEMTLSQRMEYLSRATMCAKSSTQQTSALTEGEFLHELEEKTEVVRLQLMVYEELSTVQPASPRLQEALARLHCQLLDITTLYRDFADPFELSVCKLAILQCAGHDDPSLVEALWKDIVDKELASENTELRAKVIALQKKIVSLGKTYASTEKYFPLAFLVKLLERRMCELGYTVVDERLVYTTMLQLSVPLPRLHEIYDRLYKSKDPVWRSLQQPYHLLSVIHLLLDSFANNSNMVPAYQLRHFCTVAQDAVTHYIVVLEAESNQSDQRVRQLLHNYRDLQAKLTRFT